MHWIQTSLVLLLYTFRAACLQFHPTPGSKWSSELHKMYQSRWTAKNSLWWAERLPDTYRVVIPIKLELSASVRFIHKEFVTMHGHTIVKFIAQNDSRNCTQDNKTKTIVTKCMSIYHPKYPLCDTPLIIYIYHKWFITEWIYWMIY
jgi:hypothetical protein